MQTASQVAKPGDADTGLATQQDGQGPTEAAELEAFPDQLMGRYMAEYHMPARVRPPGDVAAYSNCGRYIAGVIHLGGDITLPRQPMIVWGGQDTRTNKPAYLDRPGCLNWAPLSICLNSACA